MAVGRGFRRAFEKLKATSVASQFQAATLLSKTERLRAGHPLSFLYFSPGILPGFIPPSPACANLGRMKQTTLFLLSGTAAIMATIAVLLRIHHSEPIAETGVAEPSGSDPSDEFMPDDDFSPDAFRQELLK
jgi:hypothetical protein